MIDKKKIFDATMLSFPVEAHLSVSSSFAIHYLSIQICMEYYIPVLCIITNTVLLLGITIFGSDNREPSLYLFL